MRQQQKNMFGIWKLENLTNAHIWVETPKNLFLNAADIRISSKPET